MVTFNRFAASLLRGVCFDVAVTPEAGMLVKVVNMVLRAQTRSAADRQRKSEGKQEG